MSGNNKPKMNHVTLPAWAFWIVVLVSFANLFIFIVVGLWMLRPPVPAMELSTDVVLGLHLQLFEAFIASFGLGLAFVGFVGYQSIQASAERRADQAVREAMAARDQMASGDPIQEIDLGGLTGDENLKVEEEARL